MCCAPYDELEPELGVAAPALSFMPVLVSALRLWPSEAGVRRAPTELDLEPGLANLSACDIPTSGVDVCESFRRGGGTRANALAPHRPSQESSGHAAESDMLRGQTRRGQTTSFELGRPTMT